MNVSDRILVMYEGEDSSGNLIRMKVTVEELGLYMAGIKEKGGKEQ